ncbi:MAG: UDP-N-acetylmuramate dehydrogenase, partial [Clostridia bacterium]|nr:UDP-N-acetylmuramate dehydrogenase [Deltaproteobacteria bacterium]
GIGEKHSVVIAGTHGKTTTTALAAHVLMSADRDPGYLVGGALVGYSDSFRTSNGDFFVIEGDEYDTAYFDKGSKFLHYRAKTAVITSLEFDHADIFDSIEAVERAFAGLVKTVPADGHIVVWHGASRARRLVAEHGKTKRVTTYATTPQSDANLYMETYASGPTGLNFTPVFDGESLGEMTLPLWGDFGAANALAVIGALRDAKLTSDELRRGFASFQGVRRRLELRAEPRGIAIVDDFGHHPTAIDVTLDSARTRWPGRTLWAVFEPRSATSRRDVFQDDFAVAFAKADKMIVSSHERLGEIDSEHRFDPERLARDVSARGTPGRFIQSADAIADTLAEEAKAGDVILIFSNGAFDGLHEKLMKRLAAVPSQLP